MLSGLTQKNPVWLYSIQRKVGAMRRTGRNRKEETVISRLRFGHTRLNSNLFKIGKHQTGSCDFCGQEETVKHVLLFCTKYSVERRKLVSRLQENKLQLNLQDI